MDQVDTSHVKRQNLTMRMGMRRFTRRTNAFSTKAESHACAVALHVMHDNYCRIRMTRRVTPAIAANLVASPWTVDDIMALVEKADDAAPKKRGTTNLVRKKIFQADPLPSVRSPFASPLPIPMFEPKETTHATFRS